LHCKRAERFALRTQRTQRERHAKKPDPFLPTQPQRNCFFVRLHKHCVLRALRARAIDSWFVGFAKVCKWTFTGLSYSPVGDVAARDPLAATVEDD
jgi:hypothetical protein